jgi:hypothetical protein
MEGGALRPPLPVSCESSNRPRITCNLSRFKGPHRRSLRFSLLGFIVDCASARGVPRAAGLLAG